MRKTRTLSILTTLSPLALMAQQTAKGLINQVLEDWLLPAFTLFVIVGAIHGMISNSALIMDKHEEGTVWKGFANVGKIILFYLLAFAVLGAIVVAANAATSAVRVN